MNARAFARYLHDVTRNAHPAHIADEDPTVEFYDGTVRIFDQRGESCSLKRPFPRQLRALATMLELVAAEIERRGYEQ